MVAGQPSSAPLWRPDPGHAATTRLAEFLRWLGGRGLGDFRDYEALHRWSVSRPREFWPAVWEFTGLLPPVPPGPALENGDRLPGARWFPGARLNFAANLLRGEPERPAVIYRGENGARRAVSVGELLDATSRIAQALAAMGLRPGDRVAGIVANTPESLAAMLASAALGVIWSSSSPDFGVDAIVDRFGQIEPRLLFVSRAHSYKGRVHHGLERLAALQDRLPSVERTVLLPYPGVTPAPSDLPPAAVELDRFVSDFPPAPLAAVPLPFAQPLYILFSSGTTGKPKCIVHGAGGTLLQHLKEHQLHCDIRPGDRVFYYTTCGWMMWNWLVSALASEATLVLYDGSPFHPTEQALFDVAEQEGVTHFGISARYVEAVRKSGLRPQATHDLEALRVILSTGSPLSPESFEFVYDAVKSDVQLSSISGGTDIVSCFALGNPLGPVWAGELQVPGLGMDVAVFDDSGRPMARGKGELVCRRPFPAAPVGFWNDPDGSRYRRAYYERYPGVWHHGDYAESTAHGGLIIHGRSDATLNPGGVRVGTAEIYRQAERFDEVLECVAVEQSTPEGGRIVLFVKLREGIELEAGLVRRIRDGIRSGASSHHVPALILAVRDVPRTKSGKISELAVRNAVNGLPVGNREALDNPEALDEYRSHPGLRDGENGA